MRLSQFQGNVSKIEPIALVFFSLFSNKTRDGFLYLLTCFCRLYTHKLPWMGRHKINPIYDNLVQPPHQNMIDVMINWILALGLQNTSILAPLAKVILQKVILFFILVLKVEMECLALDQIPGSAMPLTICSLYWSVPKTSFASFPPMEKLGYWIQLCVFFHVGHLGSWDILKFVEIFWRIFCVFAVALGCQKLWS